MMPRTLIVLTCCLIFSLLTLPLRSSLCVQDQWQGTVEVSIHNVCSGEGVLIICITDSAEEFLENCLTVKTIRVAAKGDFKIQFKDLPFGRYAISLFHDKNANNMLDKRFFGIPKEDFGFSNNPSMGFGPPDFEDCAFTHVHETTSISIDLKSIL